MKPTAAISAQNRHLLLITLILAFLLTLFYSSYTPSLQSETQVQESPVQWDLESKISKGNEKTIPSICDKVDISWLASDRVYWDGWGDKTMFMKQDGSFTQGNVYINQGEQVCVVLLLGPTPAHAPIKVENHLGPKDSIVLFAAGNFTKLSIELHQHHEQTNAYYGAVQFHQADTYALQAISEYRSYFWETPVLHSYMPYAFPSQNKLIVRESVPETTNIVPACKLNNNTDMQGAWVDRFIYGKSHQHALYTMYESTEQDLMVNDKVFVPDSCLWGYKSAGFGSRCLGRKNIHVWGDNNVRRNLKALSLGNRWCNMDTISKIDNAKERKQKATCICNDDTEDTTLYPWIHDPKTPIHIGNSFDIDSNIYYNNVAGSVVGSTESLLVRMKDFISNASTADIVVVGLGNGDVEGIQVSPKQFISAFVKLLSNIRSIYPDQPIIVRTPQYFCCGVLDNTAWNTGRSLTFTKVVRTVVEAMEGFLLWDVHHLGTDETTCLSEGTSYSKRNVVNLENQLLWHLICSTSKQKIVKE